MTADLSPPGATLTLNVGLGERAYDIHVGPDALTAGLPGIQSACPRGQTLIVTDEHVAERHLERLQTRLGEVGIRSTALILPPGETSKSWEMLQFLTEAFLDAGLERKDSVIALGGGVIGDLVGFAAAITKRGLGFVQMPTTLLSQVDSSVGGKTGINTRQGKNLAGAFHQPRLVVADAGFLSTLPDRELNSGYAEIVKAALIGDADLFDQLEDHGASVTQPDILKTAIAAAIDFKARIVEADEYEAGKRALLNLGHTFGHALEADAPKDAIRHGEAVAAGMGLAFEYSTRLGLCPAEDTARVRAHLRTVGLPDHPKTLAHTDWSSERLVARMQDDKKNSGGEITLILARGIGNAYIEPKADRADLTDFLTTELT